MTIDIPLITCNDDAMPVIAFDSVDFFSLHDETGLWSPEVLLYTDFLENCVFQISRKPNALLVHIQRIYYCFHAHKNEQLYAAIIDLLIILDKRGLAISWRVVMGAKPRLSDAQFKQLQSYLQETNPSIDTLHGNRYCVFTKGLIGVNVLVCLVEKRDEEDYDLLAIARDHIEYSQLDEAKHILESAVLAQPQRFDFQEELLALYRSTRDVDSFTALFAQLNEVGVRLHDDWHRLNNYFKGQNSNG